jgi:hypothetical protein
MAENVIVTVGEDGNTTVKVEGCAGPSCKKVSEAIEKALGSVSSDVPTHEMRQSVGVTKKA